MGRYETGSKTALPIFKEFVKKTVNKSDARPFKAAEGTVMMVVDPILVKKQNLILKILLLKFIKKKCNGWKSFIFK